MTITLRINGDEVKAEDGMTILEAAQDSDIYIPRLCHHPSLGSSHGLKPVETIFREDGEFDNDGSGQEEGNPGCRLCLVEIEGRDGLFTACDTPVEEGMAIATETDGIKGERRDNLAAILKDHPHACLLCAQQDGCSRTQCSTNVPEDERCCPLLGHCELQKVSQYVGVKENLTKYVFGGLPKHENEPLFDRDHNLCISCLRCVRACRDLRGIETLGFVYRNGKAIVGPTKSSGYAESDCRFCGACAEVCPTGAITDRDLPRGEREGALVPCVANCPAGVDIPRYLWHISQGDHSKANAVVTEKLPFPTVLGMVCFHPCEDVCRRKELNDPMAICTLKRFAAENSSHQDVKKRTPSGKRVAVIGSGPAGLSAAYYLALFGHGVTVFEAENKVGGMLRYAIPDYRLLPDVLDNDLGVFDDLDVEFKTNVRIGDGPTISDLQRDFQALFIGTGATLSKRIPVHGHELQGVEWGLDFLKSVKKKLVTSVSERVMVIGGGNVAMDVARTALRLGASEVQLACLESEKEMPAHDWEIEEAREEGVIVNPSWGPKKVLGEVNVEGMELVKCISVFDQRGNFAPAFDEDTTTEVKVDAVIIAIGQSSDISFVGDVGTSGGSISTNDGMQTSLAGVFAGGEAARGPSSVVEAVADGADGASVIDRYLGGNGALDEIFGEPEDLNQNIGKMDCFADLNRVEVPKRQVEDRMRGFDMIEFGYDEEQARQEAKRCLRCDLRLDILPVTLPPDKWLELTDDNVVEVPAIEGVVQLLDEDRNIIVIKGTMDMKAELQAKLGSETKAKFFGFEPDPMFSKRESELMQQYLQQFGKMPEGDGGGDDLDDLF